MKKIVPTSLPEVKASLDTLKSAFSSSFQQLVDKGRELQQVTETLIMGSGACEGPRCDLVEGSGELFVVFEVPGLSKEDFSLEIGGGLITLRGEKKSRLAGRAVGLYLGECSYGAFQRTLSLPVQVHDDKAEAELKDGVLIVTIPKIEAADLPRRAVPVR
jgi:HSP20 family protein